MEGGLNYYVINAHYSYTFRGLIQIWHWKTNNVEFPSIVLGL